MLASYTLVDNATLTAVQRVLGQIPLRSRESVEGDLAALEQLVSSILFYEDILCIDDYKPEWRQSRTNAFPFIQFRTADEFGLGTVPALAEAMCATFRPEIRAGKFTDPVFGALLERLSLHMRCTWDISSSVYYLTLKLLGKPSAGEFEKYGQLCTAIFGELSDIASTRGLSSNEASLIDRLGNPVGVGYKVPGARWGSGSGTAGGPTKALDMFIASLNWMSYKTIYYAYAARALGADLTLHPIRHHFQIKFMERVGVYDVDFASSVLNRFRERTSNVVAELRSGHRAVALAFDLPLFSAWIVQETGNVRTILNDALQLRQDPHIARAREQLSELRFILDRNGIQSASNQLQRLSRSVESSICGLRSAFGLKDVGKGRANAGVNDVVGIYNIGASVAGWPSAPRIPDWISDRIPVPVWPPKGFAHLLRDISRDLTELPQLGTLRDQLGAAVVVDHGTYSGPTMQYLDPQYERATTEFRSPM